MMMISYDNLLPPRRLLYLQATGLKYVLRIAKFDSKESNCRLVDEPTGGKLVHDGAIQNDAEYAPFTTALHTFRMFPYSWTG